MALFFTCRQSCPSQTDYSGPRLHSSPTVYFAKAHTFVPRCHISSGQGGAGCVYPHFSLILTGSKQEFKKQIVSFLFLSSPLSEQHWSFSPCINALHTSVFITILVMGRLKTSKQIGLP